MRATSEFIFKYRYLGLVVLLALSAGAIATVALLAKPGQDLVFMESFTPSTKRTNVNRDEFYSAEEKIHGERHLWRRQVEPDDVPVVEPDHPDGHGLLCLEQRECNVQLRYRL